MKRAIQTRNGRATPASRSEPRRSAEGGAKAPPRATQEASTGSGSSAGSAGGGAGFAETIGNSPRQIAQRRLAEGVENSARAAAQREDREGLLGSGQRLRPTPVQTVQRRPETLASTATETRATASEPTAPNLTGLPDELRAGVEALSGRSMDHVRVHYDSPHPEQVGALAYTQGSDIHVAPGQEQHLPHEAWHVVQQAQGRVQPTLHTNGVAINDDAGLEQEADRFGAEALQLPSHTAGPRNSSERSQLARAPSPTVSVAQRTQAELTGANTIWTRHNTKHGVVNGQVLGDIAALQGAYAHYALPANGGRTDVQADAANPFLRKSVLGLLHDVEEIDAHAGGYYFQQEVKSRVNVARNIVNQQGARGGVSNQTDPDLIVEQGAGGTMRAIELKRTTTDNGLDGMLVAAIAQLSVRKGYASAAACVELTSPVQAAAVTGNRAAVDQTVANAVAARDGFARNYFVNATPFPGGLLQPYITLTVMIQDASGGGAVAPAIYDRDFRVHLERTAGRGGRFRYDVQMCMLAHTRV